METCDQFGLLHAGNINPWERDGSSSLSNGCSPAEPAPAKIEMVGPRRKASQTVTMAHAVEVVEGLKHAVHVGLMPNRHITIDWEKGGVADDITATGRFLKLVSDGARRHGEHVAYVWVREVGVLHGEHVHILLHVPPPLDAWFRRRKAGWLVQCGMRRGKGNSMTRIIRGARQNDASSELYAANLERLTAYLLKHCSADVCTAFGIASRGPSQVHGKRVSVSQNLHRKARRDCQSCSVGAHDA